MPAAAIPVVKPDRPMTIGDVDGQLRQLAGFLHRGPEPEERGAALIACDRLLDVRLAIMLDGEAT